MATTTYPNAQAQRTQHLFIVRMWQETDAVTATWQWRGSVKHVLTEQNYYFTRLPDLLTFITTMTATADDATPEMGQQDTTGRASKGNMH